MFHWVICRPLKYWNFQSKPKVEQIIAIITTRSVSCLFCFEFFLLLWVFSFILLRVFDFVVIFLLLLSVFAFVVSFLFRCEFSILFSCELFMLLWLFLSLCTQYIFSRPWYHDRYIQHYSIASRYCKIWWQEFKIWKSPPQKTKSVTNLDEFNFMNLKLNLWI